jgi:hypothetical protein
MATFWRPRAGGQELEAKSCRPRVEGQERKENAVCRASFRAEQRRGREGRQNYLPAGLADQNNSLSLKSKIWLAGLGPVEAASGATNAEDGGATCKPRPRRFLLSVCRRELP